MSNIHDADELRAAAEKARVLFVTEANMALTKCYDDDIADNKLRRALRWLEVSAGLANLAERAEVHVYRGTSRAPI